MPDAKETGTVQTENARWTATALHSRYVAVVLDAPSNESARSLLEAVRIRLEATR